VAIDKEVALKITADASGVPRGVAVAQGALRGLQTQIGSLEAASARGFSMSGLAGIGLSATASAAAIGASVRAAADYGDQLDNMAQRTGVAVEELSRLQYAAKLSDTSTEALAKGVGNLSKLMVGAANGGAESGKLFERFGISLRNADGTMRSTTEVLYDLSDVFAAMPAGPEKTALAMEFFGKKMGQELIPLLSQGSAGLREMGDEAERLGLVLNAEQAKAAADFNDNLDRLGQLSKSVAVSIGNALIPALNGMLGKLTDASRAKLSIWQILGALPKQGEDVSAQLYKATDALVKLQERRDAIYKQNSQDGGSTDTSAIDQAIAAEEKRVAYLILQNKRIEGDEAATASKRLNISKELAREQANLEQLKAIAAGKASADILKTDKARTDEQLKDAEKLRGALQTAWETSRKEAQKAADDAQKLLEKAAGVRTSSADKATELRNAGLSDEDKQALALSQAQDLQGQGNYYAAAAGAAKLDGRTKDFEKYQKQAESFLDRAMKFAEQAGDADTVEAVGKAQAGVIENNAKAKQGEAAALEGQATAQAATLAQLDTDIEALKNKAANIQIKADIVQAEGAVAALKQQLDALPANKTVTVTVNQVGSPAAMSAAAAAVQALGSDAQGLAYGGQLAGSAPHDRADNRLFWGTPGEWVIQRPAVRHYGSSFIAALNEMKLPKFAFGGEIGNSAISRVSIPVLSGSSARPAAPESGKNLTLVLGGERYQVGASDNTIDQLTSFVSREALRKGGRR